jgi:hypothetical protein
MKILLTGKEGGGKEEWRKGKMLGKKLVCKSKEQKRIIHYKNRSMFM